jgi:hypothetical protein
MPSTAKKTTDHDRQWGELFDLDTVARKHEMIRTYNGRIAHATENLRDSREGARQHWLDTIAHLAHRVGVLDEEAAEILNRVRVSKGKALGAL